MQINTMAMQITEKNWSVAAAILGQQVTTHPPAETYGSYVVINTFENGDVYRGASNFRRASDPFGSLTLRNILLSAENFQVMFDYDKRTKNVESFFNVTQINKRPIQIHPDQELDSAIQTLNEVWNKDN